MPIFFFVTFPQPMKSNNIHGLDRGDMEFDFHSLLVVPSPKLINFPKLQTG